jgi:hypothetical protein
VSDSGEGKVEVGGVGNGQQQGGGGCCRRRDQWLSVSLVVVVG